MNKKVLIGIITIIIIAGIAVGCLFFFNKKGNTQKNDNNNTNNTVVIEPVNNIISIAKKNYEELVGFTEDGKEISLMDFSNYRDVVYSVDNNRLYLYLLKQNTPNDINSLGYIDLGDKEYKYVELATNIEAVGYPTSVAVYGNDIYYTSSNGNGVYKYNMETKETTKPANMQMEYIRIYKLTNNKMAYMTSGTVNTKAKNGIIDLTTGEKKQIAEDVYVEYTYGNKIVYLQYVDRRHKVYNTQYYKYYEYDTDTNTSKPVTAETTHTIGSVDQSFVIPYEDYYIYASEKNIYKYANDKEELLQNIEDFVDILVLVSKDDICIAYGYGEDMEEDPTYKIFNIKNKTYTESANKAEYTNVYYIK